MLERKILARLDRGSSQGKSEPKIILVGGIVSRSVSRRRKQ
jgi:hypothetical protein